MSEANSLSGRLGTCEVCAKNAARYACPKCEVKTCCLDCVQIHKQELECNGIRDRTKYVPLSEMTERELMSDYWFLEECTRYAEMRKNDPCKRFTGDGRQQSAPLHRMRIEAAKRKMHLKFLVANFTRRKQNSSFLNWKKQRFYWHIDWHLIQPTGESQCVPEKRCDENETLAALFDKYLKQEESHPVQQLNHQTLLLKSHQSAGIGQISFWLRAEGVPNSAASCHELSAHKTLRENLTGKTIVEYPIIYVNYEQRPPNGFQVIHNVDDDMDIKSLISKVSPSKRKSSVEDTPDEDPAESPPVKRVKQQDESSKEVVSIYDIDCDFTQAENDEDDGEFEFAECIHNLYDVN